MCRNVEAGTLRTNTANTNARKSVKARGRVGEPTRPYTFNNLTKIRNSIWIGIAYCSDAFVGLGANLVGGREGSP